MPGAGRYTVVRKLADGGMAELYLGMQHGAAGFARPVVIKAIRAAVSADPSFRNQLVDEAHIVMSLTHSNIVQVLDLGSAGGRDFLILELVDGWDLDRVLREAQAHGVKLPHNLALHIAAEACRALAYAHGKTKSGKSLGIVHRDVSPHNILVSEQGEVKLTDFGIATASEKRERTVTGMIKGKVGFMSPEQADGEPIDGRSDLFSLACVLYLMVTGKRPFDAKTELESLLRTKEARFTTPDEAAEGVDNDLSNLILKAMKRDRDERFASAEEMLERIEKLARTSFEPAGQTELKKWLSELAQKSGLTPVGKLSLPPMEVSDAQILSVDGNLVLDELSARKAPPPPPPAALKEAPAKPFRGDRVFAVVLLLAGSSLGLALYSPDWLRVSRPQASAEEAQADPQPQSAEEEAQDREAEQEQDELPPAAVQAQLEAHDDAGATVLASTTTSAANDAGADAGAADPVDAGVAEVVDAGESDAGVAAVLDDGPDNPSIVSVRLESDPPGAEVSVEKRSFGSTPVSVRVRPGLTYDMRFELAGYEPADRRVFVSARKDQKVQVKLGRKSP
ncbi:MAG: serine/threonine protein kinase [Deltaproteobacteria bacterium]|nr:serine/threonine protein kinase [Deltaproteobacteria bacterium]